MKASTPVSRRPSTPSVKSPTPEKEKEKEEEKDKEASPEKEESPVLDGIEGMDGDGGFDMADFGGGGMNEEEQKALNERLDKMQA